MPAHRKGGKRTGRRPAFGTRGGPGSSYRARSTPDYGTDAAAAATGGRRYPKRRAYDPQAARTDRRVVAAEAESKRVMYGPTRGPIDRARDRQIAARNAAVRTLRRNAVRTARARTMANAAKRRKAKTRRAAKRKR